MQGRLVSRSLVEYVHRLKSLFQLNIMKVSFRENVRLISKTPLYEI